MNTILITGATGLIGKEIVKLCHQENVNVNYLTTSKAKIKNGSNYKGFYWNPKTNEIDSSCLENVSVIIHLAGATISKRWSKTYKQELIDSRILSTKLLVKTLKEKKHSVKQIVAGSAIGIYPDSLINFYNEKEQEIDSSFLGKLVKKWEASADEFSTININVAKIRTGLVLSKNGGALSVMIRPIKIGLGYGFGTGEQWQSWIHITDLAHLFMYVIKHNLTGIYNGVAPNPATNNELTKELASVLKRPLILPNIPKIIMKFVLGEMHELLFNSQRVSSKKIEAKGFQFQFYNLRIALEDLLINKD